MPSDFVMATLASLLENTVVVVAHPDDEVIGCGATTCVIASAAARLALQKRLALQNMAGSPSFFRRAAICPRVKIS